MENPTSITPPGVAPERQNLWYALVDGTLRMRATGVIESDERLIGEVLPERCPGPGWAVPGMMVRRPTAFQVARRTHATNVLAECGGGAEVERDDTAGIQAEAAALARAGQDGEVRVLPAIPWVEMGYELGDRISEIRGRQLRLATCEAAEARWPAVIERRFVLSGGTYETVLTVAAG